MKLLKQVGWKFLLPGVLALLLTGCGGGSEPAASRAAVGSATFTVRWPEVSRLIPVAANSIQVTLAGESISPLVRVLPRPVAGGDSTATFDNLPPGTLSATASAFPAQDGTGVAQAIASLPVTVTADQNTPVTLVMNSTIDRLESNPAQRIRVGETIPLPVTAKNAAGEVVLTTPQTFAATSSNTGIATIQGGTVTGVAPGLVDISITETESGKTLTLSQIEVVLAVHVQLNPTAVTLPIRGRQTFTASVTGAPDTGVVWSIQEGTAGGSITQNGEYTASSLRGTYHVVAASHYDPQERVVAVVQVQAGTAVGTIR